MAELGVSFNVAIKDTVTPAVAKLAKQIANPDPALDEIGAMLVTSTQQRFEAERSPDGKAWQEHAPATVEMRGPDATILRHKANLYDSVTHAVASKAGVRVGTNRKYSRIHQLGGKAGRGLKVTIPARPYLGISGDDAKEIDSIFKDHIAAGTT